eukprot:5188345-Prymnesium_polylepis.1
MHNVTGYSKQEMLGVKLAECQVLSTACHLVAIWLRSGCGLAAVWLRSDCGPIADRLLTDCCPIAARLLPDCCPIAARLQFIETENRDSVEEVLSRALQGIDCQNFEFSIMSKKNLRVELLLNAATRRNAAGTIVGVVGVGQDITEKK